MILIVRRGVYILIRAFEYTCMCVCMRVLCVCMHMLSVCMRVLNVCMRMLSLYVVYVARIL